MGWDIDFGGLADLERHEEHLARRGLGIDDVLAVAENAIPRRKARRIYLFGRAAGREPVVVVLEKVRSTWRPRTAWVMNGAERRWWRDHGGR